jgi:hypothetical protein
MRARALSPSSGRQAFPTWQAVARVCAGLLAALLTVAAFAHFCAPASWRGLGERRLPDRASLAVGIFLNNLLIAATPLLGGWLAAGHRARGHRARACAFAAVPITVVARSVALVGLVGGLDPGWLIAASRWWSFELAALAISISAGYWCLRRPERRATEGPAVLRRAVAGILACLAAGALIEVFTA